MYPKDDRHCWAPAVILRHAESTSSVRFYNCLTVELDNTLSAIPINEQQFERYASRRIEREKSLVGQAIVGFHPQEKVFMAG